MGPGSNGLAITPAEVTLDLLQGQPPATQAFTVSVQEKSGAKDVTSASSFALSDPNEGTMSDNVFTAGTHGGTVTLSGTYLDQTANAIIHVRAKGSFPSDDCSTCPTFPGDSAMTCGGAVATQPTIVYPSDGALLPPNMNVISVHFSPGTGNKHFEVAFQNAVTDVRVTTACATPVVDTKNNMTGGCEVTLDENVWKFIADSNRGGDSVKVSVRATPDDACVEASTNSVNIAFAEEDLVGGLYYWKSTITPNGTGGHIWRKSFGDTLPPEQLTTDANGAACFGCHSLSRDGKRMFVNHDDDDSDDEYSDVNSDLMDVETKMFVQNNNFANLPPGFQTFNPDHTLALSSNGLGDLTPATDFYLLDGDTGLGATPAKIVAAPSGKRPTQPDWSADGKNVVFVVADYIAWGNHHDDDHFSGGSLFSIPYASGAFGDPVALVTSAGENNYYPSYSPDGSFIIFDRVPKPTTMDVAEGDSFSNPKARVMILSVKSGATPEDCANLNGTGDLSNSWPRWSPFIQTYKKNRLLWVTFSSTRDYGLRVRNSFGSQVQCYPADSAEDPGSPHHQVFPANCKQPQLWMAAVNLDQAEIPSTDPSLPAFWLPFQDDTTHNHTAQWTQTVVTTPMDGGTCLNNGENCAAAPNNCCAGVCTSEAVCGIP